MKAIFQEFRLYFVIGFIVAILAGVWYIHHDGYTEGVATADIRVKTANDDRDAANKQATDLAALFKDINDAALRAQKEANAQKDRADKAIEDLDAFKANHSAEEEKWNKKLSDLATKPSCATLKELICLSVMDY